MAANTKRLPVALMYGSREGETVIGIDVPPSLKTPLGRAVSAHYPGVERKQVPVHARSDEIPYRVYLRLTPNTRSLRLSEYFLDETNHAATEPVSGLLAAMNEKQDGMRAEVRFLLTRCSTKQLRRAKRVAAVAAKLAADSIPSFAKTYASMANGSFWERVCMLPFSFLHRSWILSKGDLPSDSQRKLDDHLYRVVIELTVFAPKRHQALARKRLDSLLAAFAPFCSPGIVAWKRCNKPIASLLSVAELATLWHLPFADNQIESLQAPDLPHLPAPVNLKDGSREEMPVPLGITVGGRRVMASVMASDRLHQLVIGKSGMGKSTLLHTQIAADIAAGRGVGCVDPHGDLIADILQTIPKSRTNDVVLIDPSSNYSPRIQPLACNDPSQRALVAENNLAALSKVFGFNESSAPRLLHILRYTLLALIGTEQASYLSIRPMLTDKRFRKRVVDQVEDPEVRNFWVDEVGNWSERYEQEAMPAILNKTGQFTAHPELRRMFGAPVGDIDLRQLMDEGKVVLVSLSQGLLGEQAARFAGSVLMASFQNAAMTRANLEKGSRRPFYLYADEYATFVNESFADTLAQARKYGLFLTAAQQTITQVDRVDPTIMDAMFGNLATLVTFQVGQKDADRLAAELASDVTANDLMRLPKYHTVVRTSIDGVPTRPFVVATPTPPVRKRGHADPHKIVRQLERKHGR